MAEPEHNNLDDLFKNSGSDSLDDFEREALEGFNSLESQQEARDLQKKVEQRAQELFEKKEKSRPIVYWYAAAGLFLLIGFSVYFIFNKNDLGNKKNVAALVSNENALNAPVEAQPSGNNEYKPDDIKGKEQSQIKNQPATVVNDLQQNTRKVGRYVADELAAEKSSGAGKSEQAQDDALKKTITKEPAKSFEQKNEPSQPDLAITQPEAEKQKEEFAKQNQKSAASGNDFRVENTGKKSADVNNAATIDDMEGDKDQAVITAKMQVSNGEVAENKTKEKNTHNRKKAKSEAAPGRAAESNGITMKDTDKTDQREEDAKSSEKKESGPVTYAWQGSTNANATPVMKSETKGYYEGGENALEKDLREKLKQKDLNKKFDAILFINDKNQVEKVSFTKGDLSKEQQEKIEAVLKSLNKFNSGEGRSKDGFLEYKLSYKP